MVRERGLRVLGRVGIRPSIRQFRVLKLANDIGGIMAKVNVLLVIWDFFEVCKRIVLSLDTSGLRCGDSGFLREVLIFLQC